MRSTRQRQAIQEALSKAGRPLSPQEVLDAAQQAVPNLGIATVYRTLGLLVENRHAVQVQLPGEEGARYELAGKGHHHHFRCRNCDRVYDIDCCGVDLSRVLPAGFQSESHDILVVGLCASCNNGKRKSRAKKKKRATGS